MPKSAEEQEGLPKKTFAIIFGVSLVTAMGNTGMISVITSLALTRLLSGCAGLYRHSGRIRFSWRHGCWTAMAFMLLLGNWAAFWALRDTRSWGAVDVLVPLLFVGVLYAFCDLVMPDEPKDGQVLEAGPVGRVLDAPQHDYTRTLVASAS